MTILIVARDAAATIERAVSSCLAEPHCPLILVDDHCQDDTVARARALAGSRLRVITAPDPGGVGAARQLALEAVDTDFAAWLDADDEWVPGRVARLEAMLGAGFDIAVESIDLHDGASGTWLRRLDVPPFIRGRAGALRLFERNFLPGDTQLGFRTQVYRDAGGYDPAVRGPESFDLLLRALRRGASLGVGDEVGYRMYAYPNSLSRNLSRQRAALVLALRKHTYGDVRLMYQAAGFSKRITVWALVLMAQFRDDSKAALTFLDDASPLDSDPTEVLESDGPWPYPEGWRRAFHRGTILLAEGRDSRVAVDELTRAEALVPTAEGANNLGVALARLGSRREAEAAFVRAMARFPGYRDAQVNAATTVPSHITTHPLRCEPSRTDYVATAPPAPPAVAESGRD